MRFNQGQIQQLVDMLGGEPATITVIDQDDGHGGPGLYAYFEEFEREGSVYLDANKQTKAVLRDADGDSPLCANCDGPLLMVRELNNGECAGCTDTEVAT